MIGCALCRLELPSLCQKLMVVHVSLCYPRLEDTAVASGNNNSVFLLMLIEPLFSQVFDTTFYGIVDAMLLDAHVKRSQLAASMDVNDFVHINCAYLPRASGSRSQSVIVHVHVGVPASSAPLS